MNFDLTLFRSGQETQETERDLNAALACLEVFTEKFNARDLAGMDAYLHFPHFILSAEKVTVWERPGQLPQAFFHELEAQTGWHHTEYVEKRAVLAGARKVHFLLIYTRNRADGSVITRHENLWIVTLEDRWGVKLRSY